MAVVPTRVDSAHPAGPTLGDLPRRVGARIAGFFALDDDWVRPLPTAEERRADARLAVLFAALLVLSLELLRSIGGLADVDRPVWLEYLIVLAGTVPLAWRRRFPLTVALLTQLHFFVVSVTLGPLAYSLVVQVLCFFGLYSGVAWARDRRAMLLVVGAVLLFMFGWIAWDFAVGNSLDSLAARMGDRRPTGPLPPVVAMVIYTAVLNSIFFGGAVLWGQFSWRSARRSAMIAAQARTITEQAEDLRERALVEERLRIARELHDVVAHHVSVMGVQAGAARRALDKRPDAAAEALSRVEESSRQAVGEMRSLLGTLRTSNDPVDAVASREPGPGLAGLPDLVASFDDCGFGASYELVESPPGAAARLGAPLGLSLYRVVQESLANVRRHSTARHAAVVVRVVADGPTPHAEAEIVDDGRPLATTSGSGLGLLGMRERVASHGGVLDAGPRPVGGFRVRARFALALPAGRAR